jgi:hypothetical protein
MNRILVTLVLMLPLCCFAEQVVPIDKVENNINIRLSPDATSDVVGKLDQGSSIELVSTVEGWYEVQLEGDATGYISSDWSRVVADEPVVEAVVEAVVPDVAEDAVVESGAVEAVEETIEAVVEEVVEEVAEAVAAELPEVAAEEAVTEEPVAEELAVEELVAEELVAEEPAAPEPVVEVVAPRGKGAEVELKGTRNFLVKFRDTAKGINSQIFDDGNQVGIGTTTPKQRLEVNGSIQIHEQNSSIAGLIITQDSGDTGYIMHNRASRLTIGAGSQDRITIDRNGNVGIGVARPKQPLEMASGAHVTAGGVWTNSSSRNKKENIESLPAEEALGALMAMEPVTFNYKNESDEDYVGFIAEDVPDLVAVGQRDVLSTMDIVAVLTRVVQDQQNRIKELEARLDAM